VFRDLTVDPNGGSLTMEKLRNSGFITD
jgi:hypothetical protein